jgi:O-antigen/teichoic acid export membrane protein
VTGSADDGGRGGRLWVGLLLNGGARALMVAAPLVTLPMVTHSLGLTNYGAYAVITAIATFLPWADFGIGLGMITAVSQAGGRRDLRAVRTIVSTGVAMLVAVAAVLLAIGLVLWTAVDWSAVLGLARPGVTGDVGLAVVCVFAAFAVGIPANVGLKMMLALGMNRALAFWQAVTVPVVIVAVGVAYLTSAALPWFVLATVGTPHVVGVLAALWLFGRARTDLSPRLSQVDWNQAGGLLTLGVAFSVNSAASSVAYSTSNVVVSHTAGVDAVAVYNISARLSSVALSIFLGLLLPLWPVFGAGIAAEDYRRTRTHLHKAVLFSVAAGTLSSAVFVVAAPTLIRWWVGPAYLPSVGLLVALGVWSLVQFANYPYALLLSGAGAKRFLLTTATLMAVANLPLSILLANLWGVVGPTWANCISTTLIVVLPSVRYANRYLSGRADSPPATTSAEALTGTAESRVTAWEASS